MNSIERYLVEEVTVDYADGLISRREALRRLGLLGVGAGLAAAMLTACEPANNADSQPGPTTAPGGPSAGPVPAGPPPRPTATISFAGPSGRTLMGAWADADPVGAPKGAVL